MSKAIPDRNRSGSPATSRTSRSFGASYRSQHGEYMAALAEESVARDAEDSEFDDEDDLETPIANGAPLARIDTGDAPILGQHSMAGYYRRPSHVVGTPRPFLGALAPEAVVPAEQEWEAAISEERSLLRDNHIIPPKHPRRRESGASDAGMGGSLRKMVSSTLRRKSQAVAVEEEDAADEPAAGETTALLGDDRSHLPYGGEDTPENIARKWEEAVVSGKIHTTWQRESKTLIRYSAPLIVTFILQNSLTLTSVFTVGHIGKNELGAVSLGSMTANITGYAVYHGLATSLDTLCAQAYGSGKKKLVGLQLQRMVFFLWVITIPIAIIWLAGTQILYAVVPEKEIAELAGQYLKILIIGAPGYACFESAKRYVQAQGQFTANLYVLLIAAPLNILMHWLFVWQFEWGFIGCPIAVVITETLMPILLLLYVRFFGGLECWPGFTRKAFVNWGPMVRLALPGLIMVLAEFLAFEILTLASARISSTALAANSILQSVSVLAYQLPFPLSVAASTRVANLTGAGLPDAAKVTTKVTFILGIFLGVFNLTLLSSLKDYIPRLYTGENDVISLAANSLPVVATLQLFDSLAAQCNGLLRGLGKQELGGYVNLFAYYAIALPLSFGLGFGLHWDLIGLWAGPALGLGIVFALEGFYLSRLSYEKASEEAAKRNAQG
ncbi:Ethionine resistance-conferring protein 1 [Pseudocercospora fuligena]|uniref:Ethionine resistance-conferring protein 1 n=1 Tax=Pseudocercospora fuligena TaxID=685502 RepID=A0A8H6R7N9_9PEZI|nr:Ethionine resistance-conferring protein 1 [Pseudocercospora fuligena]